MWGEKMTIFGANWRALHQVNVGKRYVFFESLKNAGGEAASDIYTNLYNIGQSYVNEAATKLRPDTQDIEQLDKIKTYIEMIGQLAENERNNEVIFINKFTSIINQDSTGELQKCFEEFTKMENGFDYIQLIALINMLMKNKDQLEKKREEIVRNNMELLKNNFQEASPELQEKMISSYNENYGRFSGLANKFLLEPIKQTAEDGTEKITQQYQTSIPSLLASKLNSILNNIINSKEYLTLIENAWKSSQWKGNAKIFIDYTVASIMKYLTSLDYQLIKDTKGEKLAQQVINNLNNIINTGIQNLSKEYVENLANLMGKRTEKSLEEIALTTHRNLANMFMQLTDAEQNSMIQQYSDYGLNDQVVKQLLQDVNNEVRGAKNKLTKLLASSITAKANTIFQKDFNELKKQSKDEYKKLIAELVNKNKNFFKTRTLKNNIQNNLSIKIDGPSLAEFLSSAELEQALNANVYVPGRSILLKTDASFTINMNDNFDFIEPKTTQELQNAFNNFGKNFLSNYKELGKGITDVHQAKEAFDNTMRNISQIINDGLSKVNLSDEEKKKLLAQLQDFILGSISIKEYSMGTNEMGFHGGSLGPNIEKILENITTMYELGGISAIDAEALYFAAINCSSVAIGASLKDDLATYLLGGAAMMMFDEGFATTTNFMEYMVKEFGFAPQLLHLYVLQGKYIPASYVYTTIYNRLIEAYSYISSEVKTTINAGKASSNNVNIINNLSDNDIHNWNESGWHHAQRRWDDMSEKAFQNVDINFVFMAGLLDIFEAIPSAFNI